MFATLLVLITLRLTFNAQRLVLGSSFVSSLALLPYAKKLSKDVYFLRLRQAS